MPVRITIPSWTGIINKLGINAMPSFQLSEVVSPVAIVDSEITLNATSVPPLYGVPASAGEQLNPAGGTVLADSGALAAGNYTFTLAISASVVDSFRLQRRDAANAADIWAWRTFVAANSPLVMTLRLTLANNERLRVLCVSGSGAGTYHVDIFAVPS